MRSAALKGFWRSRRCEVLISETRGRVRVITLNRPGARNAVNPELAQRLYEAMLDFEADAEADVAVLTGAGGAFLAGFDL